MPQYLLRVEAVNLGAVIDDTDDLSTRRGSGLMLLYAVRQLLETLSPPELRTRLHSVATGASVGLFTFEAADDGDAGKVAKAVRTHFLDGKLKYALGDGEIKDVPLSYATFVVDVVPVGDSPDQAVAEAIAANRGRQLQQPTVSLAGLWDTQGATGECWQSCTRPAVPGLYLPRDRNLPKDLDRPVSQSVSDRHIYGRNQRQKFYHGIYENRDLNFSDSFQELSPHKTQPMAEKLAVFYADGNRFGDITREKLKKGFDVYSAWSRALQEHHEQLLRVLLDRAEIDPDWKTSEGAIRLETLLWGGDEIIWVVPGWKGWELVEWFFSQEHQVQGESLTYAAGLVFCGYKTPIHNIVRLAHRLGDAAKAVAKGAESAAHRLAYEVLESFDDVTGDLDAHRTRFLPKGYPVGALVIDPKQPPEVWNALRAIDATPDFPIRQLYMLTKAWRKGENIRDKDQPNRERLMASGVKEELETVLNAFGQEAGWLHLLAILPYLPVTEPKNRADVEEVTP